MRLACTDSAQLSDSAKISINALSVCILHPSSSSSLYKLRSRLCRAVAAADSCSVRNDGALLGASSFFNPALLNSTADCQGRAVKLCCSAAREFNDAQVVTDISANGRLAADKQWSRSDSWSVRKPLHMPLEDAVHRGNWHEARGLVDKLLSLGSLQDISSLDKLIKGKRQALLSLSCWEVSPFAAAAMLISLHSIMLCHFKVSAPVAISRQAGASLKHTLRHSIRLGIPRTKLSSHPPSRWALIYWQTFSIIYVRPSA